MYLLGHIEGLYYFPSCLNRVEWVHWRGWQDLNQPHVVGGWVIAWFCSALFLADNSVKLKRKDVASFPRFTWPKTTLQLETEHGLTSEFGMGSGGTRALWPADLHLPVFLRYKLCFGLLCFACFAWFLFDKIVYWGLGGVGFWMWEMVCFAGFGLC